MGSEGSITVRPRDPWQEAVQTCTRLLEGAQYALERVDEVLTSFPTSSGMPSMANLDELLSAARLTRGTVLDLLEFLRRTQQPCVGERLLPIDVNALLQQQIEVHP